jgi:hypothetical protein
MEFKFSLILVAGIAESVEKLAMGWAKKGLEFKFWYGEEFFLLHSAQTGSGAHPESYPMGTWGTFPKGKAAGE